MKFLKGFESALKSNSPIHKLLVFLSRLVFTGFVAQSYKTSSGLPFSRSSKRFSLERT